MNNAAQVQQFEDAITCAAFARAVSPDDQLVLRMPRRMVVQYATNESGLKVLQLFYGDKEITFEEPELFAFGETLARQTVFRAGDAAQWGEGATWPKVSECLDVLVEQGILERHGDVGEGADDTVTADRACPSPLPKASTSVARSWSECTEIVEELTGRHLEIGHLELVVPVFRVAHIYQDGEGRQVGEANVFPPALRLDCPTEWLTCTYSGTRHLVDRPMNATALKGMLKYWPQMMAALQAVRAHFFRRFPDASEGWTVGRVERLATMVLAVATLPVIMAGNPVPNGALHPALSSLFRVTDGLRMAMHQMLFVPVGDPTRAPDAAVSIDDILDYTERNYSFHSETGVCAGPKHMVREFLSVLLEGAQPAKFNSVSLDVEVQSAVDNMDQAFDYGLAGLQVYGALFSFWPEMTRCYENMATAAKASLDVGDTKLVDLHERLADITTRMKQATYLGSEQRRMNRQHVYADMYDRCAAGLPMTKDNPGLATLLNAPADVRIASEISEILAARFGDSTVCHALAESLAEFVAKTQAILDTACTAQNTVNTVLGRTQPERIFTAADINIHNLLQGNVPHRLPFLLDEVRSLFGISLDINRHEATVADAGASGQVTLRPLNSVGAVSAENRADAHI